MHLKPISRELRRYLYSRKKGGGGGGGGGRRSRSRVIVNADHVRVNADLDPRTVAIREEMDAQADTNKKHEIKLKVHYY